MQVGPYRYALEVDAVAIAQAAVEERCDLIGFCERRTQRILIRPGLAPDVTAVTVLHEVLHAVSDTAGVAADLGTEKEESVVNAIAPLLLDTLRRNPSLVAYLMGDDA